MSIADCRVVYIRSVGRGGRPGRLPGAQAGGRAFSRKGARGDGGRRDIDREWGVPGAVVSGVENVKT
jgi:hypothetical protein